MYWNLILKVPDFSHLGSIWHPWPRVPLRTTLRSRMTLMREHMSRMWFTYNNSETHVVIKDNSVFFGITEDQNVFTGKNETYSALKDHRGVQGVLGDIAMYNASLIYQLLKYLSKIFLSQYKMIALWTWIIITKYHVIYFYIFINKILHVRMCFILNCVIKIDEND